MFCPKCGKENSENNVFCLYCGTKLENIKIADLENKRNESVLPDKTDTVENESANKQSFVYRMKKNIRVIILLTVLIIIVVIFSILGIFGDKNKNESKSDAKTSISYSVEIDGKKYTADTKEELDRIIKEQTTSSIFGKTDDSVIKNGDIDVLEGRCYIESIGETKYLKFNYTVMNNSGIDIASTGINVAELDKNENILGSTNAYSYVSFPMNKTMVISGQCELEDGNCAKIMIDKVTYDCNGDHVFYESRISSEAQKRSILDVK